MDNGNIQTVILDELREHRRESEARHKLTQKSLADHGERLATLEEGRKGTGRQLKYLWGLCLTALGIHPIA